MSILFDYIYYRINKAYFKWDGRNGSTAIITLSMIQSMLLGDLVVFFIKMMFSSESQQSFIRPFIFIWTAIFIAFIFINYIKYKNKYNPLKNKWKDESKFQKISRGVLVFGAILLPWLILFIMMQFTKDTL